MPERSEAELGTHFVEDNEWLIIADLHWEKIAYLKGGRIKIGTF